MKYNIIKTQSMAKEENGRVKQIDAEEMHFTNKPGKCVVKM